MKLSSARSVSSRGRVRSRRPPSRSTTPRSACHRAVAVADSAHRPTATVNLLPGQEVLTVSDMQAKIAALLRGIGCGFCRDEVRDAIAAARHSQDRAARAPRRTGLRVARPLGKGRQPGLGLAVARGLDGATTRRALLGNAAAEPVGAC